MDQNLKSYIMRDKTEHRTPLDTKQNKKKKNKDNNHKSPPGNRGLGGADPGSD